MAIVRTGRKMLITFLFFTLKNLVRKFLQNVSSSVTYKRNSLIDFSVKTSLYSKQHIKNPLGLNFSLFFNSTETFHMFVDGSSL